VAKRRMAPYKATFMQMPSLEAAKLIKDESLDFVYIDALHDKQSVLDDITAWEPKVRIGGIVAGHDWGHRGVTDAVMEFTKSPWIFPLYRTQVDAHDTLQSWFWVKNA
jgi:hypothetical protein